MLSVVPVRISNVDLTDEKTIEELFTIEDASFGKTNGVAVMTVYADGDVCAQVVHAARCLQARVPGAVVHEVFQDLVSATDIAMRVGVSREAVRKWTMQDRQPFPAHISTIGENMRVWRWSDVVAWLLSAKKIDMEESFVPAALANQINAALQRVPDATTVDWQFHGSETVRVKLYASYTVATNRRVKAQRVAAREVVPCGA